jgi:2-iminobutanoate/2-iminopropanoate deaminase
MAQADRKWQPISLGGDVPAPAGAYSAAIRAGDLVFVSGQVPKNPKTGQLVGEDVGTQTRQVLANIRAALEAAGASLDDVVSITAYLSDIDDWGEFNAIYKEIFRPPYPTRTTIGAQLRGILVEASAVAYVGAGSRR